MNQYHIQDFVTALYQLELYSIVYKIQNTANVLAFYTISSSRRSSPFLSGSTGLLSCHPLILPLMQLSTALRITVKV